MGKAEMKTSLCGSRDNNKVMCIDDCSFTLIITSCVTYMCHILFITRILVEDHYILGSHQPIKLI